MSKEQHATREARKKPALSLKEKRAAKKGRKDGSTHLPGADKK
jgi:hypothetical protein